MAEELDPSEEPQKIVEHPAKRAGGFVEGSTTIDPNEQSQSAGPSAAAEEPQTDAQYHADYMRQTGLNEMFPDPEQFNQYQAVFAVGVDPAEKNLYTDTLLKYAAVEPDERKALGVTTRLEHFEKSPEYTEAQLKVKLSDFLKKAQASQLSDQARIERELARPGGAEAQNGLSRGEGNAGTNAQANMLKAAENMGAAGSNLAGSLTGLVTGIAKLGVAPLVAVKDVGVDMYNKVKGDGIPRQEKVAEDAIQMGIKSLAETVEKANNLPKDSPAAVVKPLIEKAAEQQKALNDQIRSQGRQGANNAMDETLTDAQRRMIKSPDEVLEAGQSNSEKVAGLMDKLAKSPALEGEGKEQLQEKAKAMALEAAEMIRKMIESIKNMFTQGNKAKAEATTPAAPSAAQAPRM